MNNNKCIIVASGPSAKNFVPPDNTCIIAVNGAIDWIKRANYFFTLDHSKVNLDRVRNPRKDTRYCVAFPKDILVPVETIRFERYSYQGTEPSKKYTPEWWLWRWSAVKGLSEDINVINSGNSAYGAIGLAYHLGYEDILLVGVDASRDEKIEGGRCKNLTHLPILLRSAMKQVKLSTVSNIDGIPKVKIKNWLRG